MTDPTYVTVMPAAPRSGWKVAHRTGDVIEFTRLENASIHEPEKARAAAAKMFPDHLVVLPADPKPWKEAA